MSYQKNYPNGWQSGEAGGTPITPAALDNIENGVANALPKDGTDPMAANLPMGGHRVTGLGDPVEDDDAVSRGYAGQHFLPKDGGTLTGWVKFDGTSIGHEWKTADGTIFQVRPYTAGNIFQIVTKTTDGKTVASFDVKNDGTVKVGKPAEFLANIGARPNTWMPTATEVGAVGAGYYRGFLNPVYGVDESTGVAYYCDLIANHLGGNVYEFNMSGKLEIGYPSSETDYAYGFVERVFLDIVNGHLPNGGAYTTTAIISSHMHLWKMDGTYVIDGAAYGRSLQYRKYTENLSFYVPARFYKVDGTSGQWQRSSFVNQIGKDEDNYARAYMQCRIVIKCS